MNDDGPCQLIISPYRACNFGSMEHTPYPGRSRSLPPKHKTPRSSVQPNNENQHTCQLFRLISFGSDHSLLANVIILRHHALLSLLRCCKLCRRNAKTVAVTVEQDVLPIALCALVRLNPLAATCTDPQSSDETDWAVGNVGPVVRTHDWLDCLGGLIGVVEGDGGDVVVQDVGLDDTVEQVAANETELAVDSCGGATSERPGLTSVVRQRRVGVLKVSDGHCYSVLVHHHLRQIGN